MNISAQPFKPFIFVALAATLWGGIGIFVDALAKLGFNPLQIVAMRALSATLLLFGYLLVKDYHLLKIKLKDLYYFLGTGILSIAFFNWCYFTSIEAIGLSVSVILLYTGPTFVVIFSYFLFNEPFTLSKRVALVLTLIGCVMVVQLIPLNIQTVSWYGILVGIGAGLGYALYSIFGKFAQRHYPTLTILFYTFLIASLVMVPLSGLLRSDAIGQMAKPAAMYWTIGLGLIPTVIAYLLYTHGLAHIEAGKASITALLEPVAATLLGVFLFNEELTIIQITGIILVVSSVLLIQLEHPFSRLINRMRFGTETNKL